MYSKKKNTKKALDDLEKFLNLVILGHSENIIALTLSPNQEYFISGSGDSIRFWNVKNMNQFACLNEFYRYDTLTISKSGKYIVTARSGKFASTIKVPSSALLLYNQKNNTTTPFIYSKRSQLANSSNNNKSLLQFFEKNTQDYNPKTVVISTKYKKFFYAFKKEIHTGIINYPIFEEYLLQEGLRNTNESLYQPSIPKPQLIDFQTFNLQSIFQQEIISQYHTSTITTILFTSNKKYAITSSKDFTIKIWDLENKTHQTTFSGHLNEVLDLAITNNDKFLLSGSLDGTLKIWDLEKKTLQESHMVKNSSKPCQIYSLALSIDNSLLLLACNDNTLRVWEFLTRTQIKSIVLNILIINEIIISYDNLYAILCTSNTIMIMLLITGNIEIYFKNDKILTMIHSDDGKFMYCLQNDANLYVFKIDKFFMNDDIKSVFYNELNVVPMHRYGVNDIALTKGGHLFSARYDGFIKSIDLNAGYDRKMLFSMSNEPLKIVLSPDDQFIVAGLSNGDIKMQDINVNLRYEITDAHRKSITSIAISADSIFMISSSLDCTTKIWFFESRTIKTTFKWENSCVLCSAITLDNQYVVVGKDNAEVVVLDIPNSSICSVLLGHKSSVFSIIIQNDCVHCISGSSDCSIIIWNLKSKFAETILYCEKMIITCISLSLDEELLYAGTYNGMIYVWDLNKKKKLKVFACTKGENINKFYDLYPEFQSKINNYINIS
ncbi:hypothetical protein SteCoe_422 [Stentor coeruleus]|uniref:Uncharacterized protein n=1 Tax=Stentor coeruleus TaxID=5963 RepID=A0A1R2D4A0_9CILI|nr:hypothetical protein SteCoe_422 [Stentor coeruleus]